jgi:hypothetical protein
MLHVMLDATNVELAGVHVHQVGNKLRQEGVEFSSAALQLTKQQGTCLLRYFFNHFQKTEHFHRLFHPAGREQNAIYAISERCFNGTKLISESRKAAEHLYDVSRHPKINAGFLYVASFRGVKVEGRVSDAIGFFKTDHFEEFFDIELKSQVPSSIKINTGTRVKSFDKGALVLNRDKKDGFRVLQAVSHSDEAQFWTDRFLQTEKISDSKSQTKDLLSVCKKFSKTLKSTDGSQSGISFLQSAYSYLSENRRFDRESFLEKLPKSHREEFDSYLAAEKGKDDIWPKNFSVDPTLIEKSKSSFRSVINLDGKIEIKIDASASDEVTQSVERGYDSKQKKHYYKIFFDEET